MRTARIRFVLAWTWWFLQECWGVVSDLADTPVGWGLMGWAGGYMLLHSLGLA